MRKLGACAAAVAAAALVVAAPLTASAAPSTSAHPAAALPSCSTGRVASIAVNLPIRSAPFLDAPLIETVGKGAQFDCTGYYALGDRYNACGHTGANGWIELYVLGGYGYTYETCMADVK